MSEALNDSIASEEEIDTIPLPVGVARGPFKKAYNAAVEFYKKDSVLDAQDRLALYEAYSSIARAQLYGGWLGFSAIFITPFAYTFYKTNTIRGVKVPRNFVLGVVGMMFSTHLCGSYVYKSQLSTMRPANMWGDASGNAEEMALKRRYEMMQLLEAGGPTKWANYFNATYQNPERRLPDPNKMLQGMKEGKSAVSVPGVLNQRDPIGLYSNRPKTQKPAKPAASESSSEPEDVFVDDRAPALEELSPWDKVRQQAVGNATPQENTWEQVRKRNMPYDDKNSARTQEYIGQNGSLFGEEGLDSMLEQEKRRIEKDM